MRSAEDMAADKVVKYELGLLKPKRFRLHNYAKDGVSVFLEVQSNKEMVRGYMGRVILRDPLGRELTATLDRDELIMTAKLE